MAGDLGDADGATFSLIDVSVSEPCERFGVIISGAKAGELRGLKILPWGLNK